MRYVSQVSLEGMGSTRIVENLKIMIFTLKVKKLHKSKSKKKHSYILGNATPCTELKFRLVFEISPSSVGVSRYPPGFGLLSEGTYLSFKDFEKYFLFFEKSRFENLSICIDPQI